MYIRTECGLIQIYEFNRNIELETVAELVNGETINYKVKKQGDNLIDVLEAGDIARDTITNTTLIIKEFDGKFVIFNDDTCTSFVDIVNFKIITHEQYMKLEQEVNNVY